LISVEEIWGAINECFSFEYETLSRNELMETEYRNDYPSPEPAIRPIRITSRNESEYSTDWDELVGFKSVSDEIEINELNKGGEVQLDVVCSVQTDYVEFLDSKGRKYQEPLREFHSHTKINS